MTGGLRPLLGLLLGLALGIVVGLASVFHHSADWTRLAFAVAAPVVLVAVAPGRAPTVGIALGWSATVLLAVFGTGEGDLLVVADAKGWTMLVSAVLLVVVALATIPVRRGSAS